MYNGYSTLNYPLPDKGISKIILFDKSINNTGAFKLVSPLDDRHDERPIAESFKSK